MIGRVGLKFADSMATLDAIMTRFPERKKPELRAPEVGACAVLVDPAKSRRLREMLKDSAAAPILPAVATVAEMPPDLPADSARELQRARRIIDDEIARIIASFPEGRKNSLFKLRFGALEEIRSLEIQAIFKRLKLDGQRVNLNRLRKINYHGETIS